jgi:UDP-N-acetylmuramate--alanine ligase
MTQSPPAVSSELHYFNHPNPAPLNLVKSRPVHFIGIGGIGMSALAKVLLAQGFTVSGSDVKENAYLNPLRDLGATIHTPHAAEQVPPDAIVIASSAIHSGNLEIISAQQHDLQIYHRSDLLREILKRFKVSIGLSGSHGKTTLTGMTGLVLEAGELDPTIIAGGKIPQLGTNAKTGADLHYAVAELDESDGTIVQYSPTLSVLANLELDHPDHYQGGIETLMATFHHYLEGLSRDQAVLFNMDCPNTHRLYRDFAHRVEALKVYTESVPDALDAQSYTLQNVFLHLEGGYQGDVFCGYEQIGSLWLQVPGRHNLSNALFAAIIGHRLGISFDVIRRSLENFTGMGRRFEKLGVYNGARIIDDYAHHPTEVLATLKAAREFNQHKGRVIAVFQPHRYSRFQTFWNDFLTAFEDADEVIVLDIYGSGESPMDGISAKAFVKAMNHPSVEYWPSADWDLVQARLKTMLTPGDLLITLGAGDVTQVGRTLVASP